MRRKDYAMDRDGALEAFRRAEFVRFATTTPGGAPVLRTVNAVVVDGAVCFHGAPAGEKSEAIGREAVVAAEEVIAPIPSYFVDAERACPATTLYLSAQAHGPLEAVDEPAQKARVLQALMEKYQPEGGHAPISADHPLYRREVKGLLIVRVALEKLDGKAKVLQNRKPHERAAILELLWRRGLPGDTRTIELVRDFNPDTPAPAFLAAPEGLTLHCHLDEGSAREAAALLEGAYWNGGLSRERIEAAQRGSNAWAGARDASGALVGTARALSDGAKCAWVWDVMVRPDWRGRGVGRALMRLLLDHPRVRSAATVRLHTRDAQALYQRFGFVETRTLPPKAYVSTEMALLRR